MRVLLSLFVISGAQSAPATRLLAPEKYDVHDMVHEAAYSAENWPECLTWKPPCSRPPLPPPRPPAWPPSPPPPPASPPWPPTPPISYLATECDALTNLAAEFGMSVAEMLEEFKSSIIIDAMDRFLGMIRFSCDRCPDVSSCVRGKAQNPRPRRACAGSSSCLMLVCTCS